MQEAADVRDIRSGTRLREEAVKDAEQRVRQQHDYRFVLQYFSASHDLHGTLADNVSYLATEVEQLRAQIDHMRESRTMMEEQLVELEVGTSRQRSHQLQSQRVATLVQICGNRVSLAIT